MCSKSDKPGAFTVVYDGWDLAYQPNSPGSLYLLTLLAYHPPEAEAVVVLPAESFHPLPQSIRSRVVPTPATQTGNLRWEQRLLPSLFREHKANLLHLVSNAPPLFGRYTGILSPATAIHEPVIPARSYVRIQAVERLRLALAQGGASRLQGILWPSDLPKPHLDAPLYVLPPVVHPAFDERIDQAPDAKPWEQDFERLQIPDGYIICHALGLETELRAILGSYSWAADAIGENFPLLIVGLAGQRHERLSLLITEYHLEKSVRSLPALSIETLAALYKRCSVLLHPGMACAWGEPLRHALACAKPAVSVESPAIDRMVGPAAYLVPQNETGLADQRALGAAVITLAVEGGLAEKLSMAARQRALDWQSGVFADKLWEIYQQSSNR